MDVLYYNRIVEKIDIFISNQNNQLEKEREIINIIEEILA